MARGSRQAAGPLRVTITLSCTVCGARNYKTTKAQRQGAQPLELRKFCKHCNQHTLHREGK